MLSIIAVHAPLARSAFAAYSCAVQYSTCNAGYGPTANCPACSNGYYKNATGTGSCTACATGSRSASSSASKSCVACGAGLTTAGAGTAAAGTCRACSNTAGIGAWTAPYWSANSVVNLCRASTCIANYYLNGYNCTACPSNSTKAGTNATTTCTCGAGYAPSGSGSGLVCNGVSYTIVYNANGGGGSPANLTCKYGAACSLTTTAPTMAPSGYSFVGWATSTANAMAGATVSTQNNATTTNGATITVYAVWRASCAAGQIVAAANAACSVPGTQGYSAAHTVYRGKTSVYTSCPTNYQSNLSTAAGEHDAQSDCKASCAAGNAVQTANAACSSISAKTGYWVAAHSINYGSITPTGTTAGATTAATINLCPANYQKRAGTTAQNQCQTSCAAGQRVAAANAACSTTATEGYSAAHNVNYGSTSSYTACPANYKSNLSTAAGEHDAQTDCKASCAAGNAVQTANAACTSISTKTGYWAAAHSINYGSITPTGTTAGATTAATINLCPANYQKRAGTTAQNQCQTSCAAGQRVAAANAACSPTATEGYSAAHNVNYGSTSSYTACPENYKSNLSTAAGEHDAQTDCKASCAAGNAVQTANAACSSISAKTGYWVAAHTVNYGSITPTGTTAGATTAATINLCPANYQSGAGTTAQASCKPANCSSAGYYWSGSALACTVCNAGDWCTGATTVTYGARTTSVGANRCSTALGTGYTSAGGTGDTANTKCYLPVAAGKIRSGASGIALTTCAAGKYRTAHNAYYGTAYACDSCPALEAGARYSTNTGITAVTGCIQHLEDGNISSYCDSGQLTKNATNATTWGAASITAALNAKAGAYVVGMSCSKCPLGSWNAAVNASTVCDMRAGICQAAAPWSYIYSDGTCWNCTNYQVPSGTTWVTPSWNNGSPIYCRINACPAGYTKSADAMNNVCNANTFYVKYDANGGGGAPGNLTCKYASACTLTSTAPTTAPGGYAFVGWATSAANASAGTIAGTWNNATTTAGGTVTAYAVWKRTNCTQSNTIANAATYNAPTGIQYYGGTCQAANRTVATCNGGYYGANGATACGACPAGYAGGGAGTATQAACKPANCGAGNYWNGAIATPACALCPSGKWCGGATGMTYGTRTTTVGLNSCPALEANATRYSITTGISAVTGCIEVFDPADISPYCNSGVVVKYALNATTWGELRAHADYPLTAKAGARVSGLTCAECAGATWSAGGSATSCTACPAGYSANTAAGKSAAAECQISCAAGTRIAAKNGACSTPAGAWFTTASHAVNYGGLSPVGYCMKGFENTGATAANHQAAAKCAMSVPAGKRIAAPTIQARYVRFIGNGNSTNTGNHIVEIEAYASSNATGTNMLSGKTAVGGNAADNARATDGSWARGTYATCGSAGTATGCSWDMGAVKTIGSIRFGLFSDGRTINGVRFQVSTDNSNWTDAFGPLDIITQNSNDAIAETLVVSSVPVNCAAGTYRGTAYNVALGSTSSCTPCVLGAYSASGASACAACGNGTTTGGTGRSSCDTTCGNSRFASTWKAAAWVAAGNTVSNSCSIATCVAGAAMGANACNAIAYGISYNANGGAHSGSPATYDIGLQPMTLTNATRNGYTFAGWCDNQAQTLNCAANKQISGGTIGNKEYWAKWAPGCIGAECPITCKMP